MGGSHSQQVSPPPPGCVDVPFRQRSGAWREQQCDLPRAEIPCDLPRELAGVLSPAEFSALMAPLQAVVEHHRMTYMAARFVGKRAGLGIAAVFLALLIAAVSLSAFTDKRGGRNRHVGVSPLWYVDIAVTGALFGATVLFAHQLSRRELEAVADVRAVISSRLAPALAGRGVHVEVVTSPLFSERPSRLDAVACTAWGVLFSIRFQLPGSSAALQPLQEPLSLSMARIGVVAGGHSGHAIPVAAPVGWAAGTAGHASWQPAPALFYLGQHQMPGPSMPPPAYEQALLGAPAPPLHSAGGAGGSSSATGVSVPSKNAYS